MAQDVLCLFGRFLWLYGQSKEERREPHVYVFVECIFRLDEMSHISAIAANMKTHVLHSTL